jgi:uncharacterized protein involved in type VI secretion and phage assembly
MSNTLEPRGGPPGKLFGTYLAEVVSVKDDKQQGRIQVKLLPFDGIGAQNAPFWARVAVPYAGNNRGAYLIPSKGDEVIVQFLHGDPSHAVVTGGLWNGKNHPPEQLGGSGEEVDRWTFVGKQGTRIAIVEEQAGATISLTTPSSKESVTITQRSGGKIELKTATSTVTLDSQGVSVKTTKLKVTAQQVEVDAPTVTVNAVMSKFNGVVKAPVVQATSIVAQVYTPGVGNVW